MKYDFLIVGSGLFGAVCAHELKKRKMNVLVIEKRRHIGGNVYTENVEGIQVHRYGAHIFHTNSERIWRYINQFSEFNRFTNSPLAEYEGKLYSLPFNMLTFNQLWGVKSPDEAKKIIENQRKELAGKKPANLEEQAISLVGRDVYEKLIKGYTEKQWGRPARDLPAFIIKRIPVRFTYDNNYFPDKFQGIPVGGYTKIIEMMLQDVEVTTRCDYFENKQELDSQAKKVIYTGPIDRYFDYCFGRLEYRSLDFETTVVDCENYQGNAVINNTEIGTKYTRTIEHKHFDPVDVPVTVVTKEFPAEWEPGKEEYYPVNDERNNDLYKRYRDLAKKERDLVLGGRLAEYKYYDMHQVIASALKTVEDLCDGVDRV